MQRRQSHLNVCFSTVATWVNVLSIFPSRFTSMYFAYTWREHVRASKPSFPPMARTGRSVYQQHKSRCLCLRDSCVWQPYQNTNSPARAKKSAAVFSNPLSLLPRETKSWPFIYDLSPFLTARLPRNNKKIKKKHTHNEDRVFIVTFHLCVCVFNMLWMQQTDSGKNDVKCVSTTLLDPHRGSWPPVLSARPSLLSPHLQ